MNILKDKVALVTGAGSRRGMGRAIALKLAAEGADVVVVDVFTVPPSIRPEDQGWEGLNAVVNEVRDLGRQGLAVETDISKSTDVDTLVSKALGKFGKIDILVNCAGIRGPVPTHLVDMDEKDWRKVMDINLTGTFLISKAVARTMIPNGEGKKIVLISSGVGIKGVAGSSAYSVSKHGVEGIIKTLALELARYKINVNGIRPGAIDTNFRDESLVTQAKATNIGVEEMLKKEVNKGPASMVPLGRMGTPEDIADLVLFLVSEQSRYITGESFAISGGMV